MMLTEIVEEVRKQRENLKYPNTIRLSTKTITKLISEEETGACYNITDWKTIYGLEITIDENMMEDEILIYDKHKLEEKMKWAIMFLMEKDII